VSGDRRSARDVYQSYFEYDPQAKFWIGTNHLPQIRGTNEAIWRRIRRVRFDVVIPKAERDRHLKAKLRKARELSGILNWALAGLQAWLADGLGEPRRIEDATKAYRVEQDIFGSFLEEACVIGEAYQVKSVVLYERYREWCQANGYHPMAIVSFGKKLKERRFRHGKRVGKSKARTWRGLKCRNEAG
jgi:putative DNA primase/helicase